MFQLLLIRLMMIWCQVISGNGFLGVGSIAINDDKIKGLNTAAAIWCVAVIVVLVGLGLIFEALIGTFVIIFVNVFVKKIKEKFFKERGYDEDL